MKISKNLLPVVAVAALFSGCQDEDFGYEASAIRYQKSFTDAFGQIDPNQDWNCATRAFVNVTTQSNCNVKIYAKVNDTYKIVGDYADVVGTKELGIDILKGTQELLVSNGEQSFKTFVGGSVNFVSTRTVHTIDGSDLISVADEYKDFDAAKYAGAVVADDGFLPEENMNLDKVTQDFSYVSNGAFTIYPMYWNTSSSHILGIYWKEADGYHYQDVYTDKAGDELATKTENFTQCQHEFNPPTVGSVCSWHGNHSVAQVKYDEDGNWTVIDNNGEEYPKNDYGQHQWTIEYHVGDVCPEHGTITKLGDYGAKYTSTISYTGVTQGNASPSTGTIGSKAITINLPAGTQFGFFLRVYTSGNYFHTVYSEGSLNKKQEGRFFDTSAYQDQGAGKIRNKGLNTEGTNAYAATFSTEVDGLPVRYLCFEDWSYNLTDLNDLVFAIPVTESTPIVVDEEATPWIICAEDLGNTFDLDYNDVVVEVQHISGNNDVTITPLAAGGTLASYLYFEDANNGETCLGEVHELLGQANAMSGDYTPINVSGGNVTKDLLLSKTFNVSESWSIASSTVGDESYSASAAMGGFKLKVVPAGEESTETKASIGGQTIQNSTAKGKDNIPYVICLPRNYTREYQDGESTHIIKASYRWSNEMKPMYNLPNDEFGEGSYIVEGHSFADWVAGVEGADDWYQYPNIEQTTGLEYSDTEAGSLPEEPTEPEGNDYSAFGTEVAIDGNAVQYCPNVIATSALPTEGSVTITFVVELNVSYVNIQNPVIRGKKWIEDPNYSYWDNVTLGEVSTSNLIQGDPDYATVSTTIDASNYAECGYIEFSAGYIAGTVSKAFFSINN